MTPRRILLAQTSFLGDIVLTTPLWRALRDALPETEVWWLVRPDAVPIVAPLAGAGRVLVFDKRGGDGGPGGLARVAVVDEHVALGVRVAAHEVAGIGLERDEPAVGADHGGARPAIPLGAVGGDADAGGLVAGAVADEHVALAVRVA